MCHFPAATERQCGLTSHRLTFHRALHCISYKRYGNEQCNDFLGRSGKEQEASAQPDVLIHDPSYAFMLCEI